MWLVLKPAALAPGCPSLSFSAVSQVADQEVELHVVRGLRSQPLGVEQGCRDHPVLGDEPVLRFGCYARGCRSAARPSRKRVPYGPLCPARMAAAAVPRFLRTLCGTAPITRRRDPTEGRPQAPRTPQRPLLFGTALAVPLGASTPTGCAYGRAARWERVGEVDEALGVGHVVHRRRVAAGRGGGPPSAAGVWPGGVVGRGGCVGCHRRSGRLDGRCRVGVAASPGEVTGAGRAAADG